MSSKKIPSWACCMYLADNKPFNVWIEPAYVLRGKGRIKGWSVSPFQRGVGIRCEVTKKELRLLRDRLTACIDFKGW